MRRFLTLFGMLLAVLAMGNQVWAQQEITDALANDPVYVETGVDVDRSAVERSVEEAATAGFDLRVVVLGSGSAEQTANSVRDAYGGTVLAFTPDAYFAVSNEVSQGRLEDATATAADELGSLDTAAGVAAFVDALEGGDGGVSFLTVALVGGAILLVVAVVGRIWERRTRASRQARRRERRRTELSARAQATGGEVVELSDAVELADSREVSDKYAQATAIFKDIDGELVGASSMNELDRVEERLAEADLLLSEVREAVRPRS